MRKAALPLSPSHQHDTRRKARMRSLATSLTVLQAASRWRSRAASRGSADEDSGDDQQQLEERDTRKEEEEEEEGKEENDNDEEEEERLPSPPLNSLLDEDEELKAEHQTPAALDDTVEVSLQTEPRWGALALLAILSLVVLAAALLRRGSEAAPGSINQTAPSSARAASSHDWAPSPEFVRALVADEMAAAARAREAEVAELTDQIGRLEKLNKEWAHLYEMDARESMEPATRSIVRRLANLQDAAMLETTKRAEPCPAADEHGETRQALRERAQELGHAVDQLGSRIEQQEAVAAELMRRSEAAAQAQAEAPRVEGDALSLAAAKVLLEERIDQAAADLVGRPDFALAAVGTTVERRKALTGDDFVVMSLNDRLWQPWSWFRSVSRPAEAAIDSDLTVGNCWACATGRCNLTLQLSREIAVDAVSVDHISRAVALDIRSAPKDFRVYGIRRLPDGPEDASGHELLGEFQYDAIGGRQVQTFELSAAPREAAFPWIKFEVLNNHGHGNWTCLYRVRVHGKTITTLDSSNIDI